MPTSTVENYLKALYAQQSGETRGMVPMGKLASAMGVVPGTATSMVKALAESGLVAYAPRGGVRLTARGEQLALHVMRRHRLIELFLVEVLKLDWAVVHDEADQLEHAVSDRVLDRLDAMLGHPTVDPHGDPIPSAKGQLHEPPRMNLVNCPVDSPQRIARVLDQDPQFLRFVESQGLRPGASVTVEQREQVAEVVRLRIAKREHVSLGWSAAAKILVESTGAKGK